MDTEDPTKPHTNTLSKIEQINLDKQKEYKTFYILKKDHKSFRVIRAPNERLKQIQREILSKIYELKLGVSANSHGFVKNRNIVTNAWEHTGVAYVLQLDIKDFFPSLTERVVLRELSNNYCPDSLINKIKEYCFLDGVLPQGAPTSPALANIALKKFDHYISHIVTRYAQIKYTRYADNLIFSSEANCLHKIPNIVSWILKQLDLGLVLNRKKINLTCRTLNRVKVCGVVINARPNAPKRFRRNTRAALHNLLKRAVAGDSNLFREYRVAAGRVAFIEMVNPKHATAMKQQMRRIKAAMR